MTRDRWVLPDELFDDPEAIDLDADDPADCVPWGAPIPRQRDVGITRRYKQLMRKKEGET